MADAITTQENEAQVDIQGQEPRWEIAASPHWAVLPTTLRPLMPNRIKQFRKKQPNNKRLLVPKSNPQNSPSPDDSTITTKEEEEEEEDETEEGGFSPFVAFCFTINYILGTGFLTIPWAFVQSGLLLSTCVLVMSAFVSDMAKDYLLETMARAEAMLDDDMPMHWRSNTNTNTTIANTATATSIKKRAKPTILSPKMTTSTMSSTHDKSASLTTKQSQHKRQRSCPETETGTTPFQLADIESALQEN